MLHNKYKCPSFTNENEHYVMQELFAFHIGVIVIYIRFKSLIIFFHQLHNTFILLFNNF